MNILMPLDNSSLRERVYCALRDAIVSGELAPGQRLRDQHLAAQLGVSRTPVREALQRLEDDGLVETTPRALTSVAPLAAQAAREAFPVVAALHALAARHSVTRLTAQDIAEMQTANDALAAVIARADTATTLQAIQADDRFHAVLLRAAGNAEITRALAHVMPKVRRLEYAQFGSLTGYRSVQQHAAIIAACQRRDVNAVAALVEENWLSLGRLIASSIGDEADEQREEARDG